MYENYLRKNAGMNKSTVSYFTGITGISFSTLWNRCRKNEADFSLFLAEFIKTIRLLSKDCFAGYRYKKLAVINEHCALNGLLML